MIIVKNKLFVQTNVKHSLCYLNRDDADLIPGTNGKGTGPLPSNLDGSNFSGSDYSGFLCVA